MDIAKNRPRVFLSHSKADLDFIEKISDGLRFCQIDPWMDSIEIRHGHPWLDEIFESGMPACDAILVYLTENSINSQMVKKEIDAGILQKLKDSQIAFLPYVSYSTVRNQLRNDLQALQAPEWNPDNYEKLLPRVVSEIWRSYLERVVTNAVNAQRVRRLEAELELERIKSIHSSGIFSGVENEDFKYIKESLDLFETVSFAYTNMAKPGEREILRTITFKINVLSLVVFLSKDYHFEYNFRGSEYFVKKCSKDVLPDPKDFGSSVNVKTEGFPELTDRLLMYGLIRQATTTESRMAYSQDFDLQTKHFLVYTEKMNRFKYWLSYNNFFSDGLVYEQNNTLVEDGS